MLKILPAFASVVTASTLTSAALAVAAFAVALLTTDWTEETISFGDC